MTATPITLEYLASALRRVAQAVRRLESSKAPPVLLTPNEVARRYRTSRATVLRLIELGQLRATVRKPRRGARAYLIPVKDADMVLGVAHG